MWVPAVKYFKEIPTFIDVQIHQSEVVHCEKVIGCHLVKQFLVTIGLFGFGQFVNQLACFDVFDCFEFTQGTNTECIGKVAFNGTGFTGNDEIFALFYPFALGKLFNDICIKHPFRIINTVVKVGSRIFQGCLFNKVVQLFVVLQIPFGIYQLLNNLAEWSKMMNNHQNGE